MRLWYAKASPFVRKVLIVAHERELIDKIELLNAAANVVDPDKGVITTNPTGKIPALVLEDGADARVATDTSETVLFDSRVICDYLDSIHDGKRLTPRSGSKRYEIMTLEALGDAIMDAAVGNRYETFLRPEDKRWDKWSEGQMLKVTNGLDRIEANWLKTLGRVPNMGSISVACALGYLDFRYSELNWRKGRKGLARWFKRFEQRGSYIATRHDS